VGVDYRGADAGYGCTLSDFCKWSRNPAHFIIYNKQQENKMSEEHSKLPRLSDDERKMLSLLKQLVRATNSEEEVKIPHLTMLDERYIDLAILEGLIEDSYGQPWRYNVTVMGHNFISTLEYKQSLNLFIRRKEQEAKAAVYRVSKNGTLLDDDTYDAYPTKELLVDAAQQVATAYGSLVTSIQKRGFVEVDPTDGWKLQATPKGLDYLKMAWSSGTE
jgi:hypothetical protein